MPPQTSPHVCAREVPLHFFDSPAARIISAVFLLVAGVSLAAVFWKMPKEGETYALYYGEIVDKELAVVQLPDETVATITLEEMRQMSLPDIDMAPAFDEGAEKYAQMYPAPPGLAAPASAQKNGIPPTVKEPEPNVPKKLEPMRPPIEEKSQQPIETVKPAFQPKPTSVNPAERSDELLSEFRFAEGSRTDFGPPPVPVDPFPVIASSQPALQPLQSVQSGGLSPLQPLKESELSLLPLAAQ